MDRKILPFFLESYSKFSAFPPHYTLRVLRIKFLSYITPPCLLSKSSSFANSLHIHNDILKGSDAFDVSVIATIVFENRQGVAKN